MALITRKQDKKPINVSVFGAKASALQQYQQELIEIGYYLDFPETPLSLSVKEKQADIYIVDFVEIEQSQATFQSKKLPYLIHGLDKLPEQGSALEILYNAVGYFIDTPSANSIRLHIQLGLQRHRERQSYSQRVQDISEKIENNRFIGIATGLLISKTDLAPEEVFSQIKLTSRNKQRRTADVAKDIILALTLKASKGKKIVRDKGIDDLPQWLDGTVTHRNNR